MVHARRCFQANLVADVLAMLQDESVQPAEDSSYQIDLFNDLDLAVLG